MQQLQQKPFYTRIALLGVACALALAALIIVPILIFSPGDIVFPVIIAVISLIVGALITFVPRPVNLIFAVLGGLFCLLFGSDGLDLSLGTPASFFDFSFPIFLFTAAVLLLIGGIAGLVQYFQHKESTGNATLVTAIKGVFGVLVVVLVVSAVLTALNLGSASAADKEGAAYVKAKDTEFNTDSLSTSPTGKIVVDNNDPVLHTFTIDDLDIDVKIGPGSHEVINLDNVKAGEYYYYCRVSGHEDMDGKLTVK